MSLLDKTKQILCEMAYNKSKAEDLLADGSCAINEHIMKLLIWGWNTDWAKTVYDISNKACGITLKPSCKKPDYAFVENNLFKGHFNTTKDFLKALVNYAKNYKIEYGLYEDINLSKAEKSYEQIKKFVISEITTKFRLDRELFYSKLKALI